MGLAMVGNLHPREQGLKHILEAKLEKLNKESATFIQENKD